MRRMTQDSGAVAVVVALLAVALFGFGALVIDVGALYAEKRDLQNGTDAAALALAQACAAGNCGALESDAEQFVDGNAADDASDVTEVCGAGTAGLSPCLEPLDGLNGSGYVRVTARTEDTAGGHLVPPFLAQVLDASYEGSEIQAVSTVIWGPPAPNGTAQLAITFSQCEYDLLTKVDGETVYASTPFEDDVALERTIFLHDTTAETACHNSGSGSDLPGGFGWLTNDAACRATIENSWADADTGNNVESDCKAALAALLGKVVHIPVFDKLNDLNGTNGAYRIHAYAAFVLTGWNFPGTQQMSPHRTQDKKTNPCDSSQSCISGFFVESTASGTSPVGSGADLGVRVTQLIP